jgi:hypothetical protein
MLTTTGIFVRFSENTLPMTNKFRHTLNCLFGKETFPVNHQDISWNDVLTVTPKKPAPRLLTVLTEPRARDEWTMQMSCKARRGPDWKESHVGNFYQSNGRRGRKNSYKDRAHRTNTLIY